jgi:ParB family chromosome partitioning protein
LARLDQAGQLELLAHCASLTVNAMRLPKRTEAAALAQADVLAETLGLDMKATWTPTGELFWPRIEGAHRRSRARRRLA